MHTTGKRLTVTATWTASLIVGFGIQTGIAQADYLSTLNGLGGIISHWGMEETSGTSVADLVTGDSVDGNNPGSFTGGGGADLNAAGPRPSDGFGGMSSINSAIDFSGVDGQHLSMSVGGYTGVGGLVSASMAVWFKIDEPASANQHNHIGGIQNSTTGSAYGFAINHYGTGTSSQQGLRVFARVQEDSVSGDLRGYSTPYGHEYRDGQWHLAVATIEPLAPDTRTVSMYVDGVLVSQDTTATDANLSATDPLAARDVIYFGQDANAGSSARTLIGQLDEIAFFDHALPASSISELYDAALGIPTMTLVVDRLTGSMSLGASNVDAEIQGYSITSPTGALNANASDWRTISANYDASGDGSVDSDDEWTILSEDGSHFDLSEFEFGGNGGLIANGNSVLLSQPGGEGAWIPTSVEDLQAEVTLVGGTKLDVNVVYTGDGGDVDGKLFLGDFDHDGDVDVDDWLTLRDNTYADLTGLTEAQRHAMGDITLGSEAKINIRDFSLFMQNYNLANPGSSFAEMLASVPEPSTALLLGLSLLGLAVVRRRRPAAGRTIRPAALCIVAFTLGCGIQMGSAHADYVSTLNNFGGLISHWGLEETAGASVADAVVGDSVDGNNGGTVSGSGVTLNVAGPRPSDGFIGFSGSNSAIDFTGTADQLLSMSPTGSGTGYTGAGGLTEATMTVWFRITGGQEADDYFLGGLYNSTGSGRYGMVMSYYDNDDRLRGFGRVGNPTGTGISTGNGATPNYLDSTWHLAVLTMEQDTSDRVVSLYVDGALEATASSAAVPSDALTTQDTLSFGYDSGTSGTVASGARGMIGQLDEIAFLDHALSAEDVSELYQAAVGDQTLKIVIQPVTGEVRITNNTASTVGFNSYQIETSGGQTDTLDTVGWNSLDEQNVDAVGTGDGETWDAVPNSSAFAVAEQFFAGSTSLASGESISIGEVYDPSVGSDVSFRYTDISDFDFVSGLEEFALLGDMDGNGFLEEADINPFVQALTDRAAYDSSYGVDADFLGDFNGNGQLDLGDIAGFKLAISSLTPGAAEATSVPEPSSIILLGLSLVGLLMKRGRAGV